MNSSIEIVLFKDDYVVQSIRCKRDYLTSRNIKILFAEYIEKNEIMIFIETGERISKFFDLGKQEKRVLNVEIKRLDLKIIDKKKYDKIRLDEMLFEINTINWIREWERNSNWREMDEASHSS